MPSFTIDEAGIGELLSLSLDSKFAIDRGVEGSAFLGARWFSLSRPPVRTPVRFKPTGPRSDVVDVAEPRLTSKMPRPSPTKYSLTRTCRAGLGHRSGT